jgi:hypothetical protein
MVSSSTAVSARKVTSVTTVPLRSNSRPMAGGQAYSA